MKKGLSVVLSFALTASFACTAFAGETEADAYSAEVVNIAIQPSAAFVPLYYAKESGWIEDALSDYEQTFETRQKEYVEFFKRELDALERRAKAADEARVETEARLSRIAAALRG